MYPAAHLYVSRFTSACIYHHICLYPPVFHGYIHTHTAIKCFNCAKSAARRLTRISLACWHQPALRVRQRVLQRGQHQHQRPHRHFPSGDSPSVHFQNHHRLQESAALVDWLHGNVSKIRRTRLHSHWRLCENSLRMPHVVLVRSSHSFAGDRSRT